MSLKKEHLESLIVRVTYELDLYSESAVNLILGTIAQESAFGTYLKQLGSGIAKGIVQMENATEFDIWENYLKFKPELTDKLFRLSGVIGPDSFKLEGDLIYQIAMCRIHYLRVKEALPDKDDLNGLAKYYKVYYNTKYGRATTEEFIANYKKYVL